MAEVTITVDGKKIQVASGSLLIDVCKRAGIETPSFCYYPGLSLQDAWRMCLVESLEAREEPSAESLIDRRCE